MHGGWRELYPVFRSPANPFPKGQGNSASRFGAENFAFQRSLTATPVLTGHVLRHGLHIWPGVHCGPGPPSALTWIELESAPASSRLPTRKSKNLFTMELLFEWIGKFNRANVGFNSGGFFTKPETVRFSEIRKMTLKSALEDLLGTTLAGVAGIVGKIEYVASLRDAASGAYSHWGLTRAYGETAAQQRSGGSASSAVSQTAAHSAARFARRCDGFEWGVTDDCR